MYCITVFIMGRVSTRNSLILATALLSLCNQWPAVASECVVNLSSLSPPQTVLCSARLVPPTPVALTVSGSAERDGRGLPVTRAGHTLLAVSADIEGLRQFPYNSLA